MVSSVLAGLYLASLRTPVDALPWSDSASSAMSEARASGKLILMAADPSRTGAVDGRLLILLRNLGSKAFDPYVLIHGNRSQGAEGWQSSVGPMDSAIIWLDPEGRELLRTPAWIGGARFLLYGAQAKELFERRKQGNLSATDRLSDEIAAGNTEEAERFVDDHRSTPDAARLSVDLAEHYLNRRYVHSAKRWARVAAQVELPSRDEARSAFVQAGIHLYEGYYRRAFEALTRAIAHEVTPAEREYAEATLARLKDRIAGPVVPRSR